MALSIWTALRLSPARRPLRGLAGAIVRDAGCRIEWEVKLLDAMREDRTDSREVLVLNSLGREVRFYEAIPPASHVLTLDPPSVIMAEKLRELPEVGPIVADRLGADARGLGLVVEEVFQRKDTTRLL